MKRQSKEERLPQPEVPKRCASWWKNPTTGKLEPCPEPTLSGRVFCKGHYEWGEKNFDAQKYIE